MMHTQHQISIHNYAWSVLIGTQIMWRLVLMNPLTILHLMTLFQMFVRHEN